MGAWRGGRRRHDVDLAREGDTGLEGFQLEQADDLIRHNNHSTVMKYNTIKPPKAAELPQPG